MLIAEVAPPPQSPPEHHARGGRVTRHVHQVQHALIVAKSRRVPLTSTMHGILHTWGRLLASLERRITHLREIPPFPPSWFGAADASGTGMGGVCQYNSGQWFVWHAPFSAAT